MKEFMSLIWHERVKDTPTKERQKVRTSNVEWYLDSFFRVYMQKPRLFLLFIGNMLYSLAIIE